MAKTKQQLRDYANTNRNTNGVQSLTGATENIMWNDVIDSMALEGSSDFLYLAPQGIAPPYKEGNVWYDDNKKTLAYQNEVSGIELNLGETWLRVINKSGAVIPNGSVVKNTGSDALGLPTIELAMANEYVNAYTVGITTHEIGIDEIGYVTTSGEVGMDTLLLTEGQAVYLSATTAGALTSTAPTIASVLGLCIVSDAADGRVFVNVQNLLNFPGSLGILQELNTPAVSLTAGVPATLLGWTNSWDITMLVDAANGTITLPDITGFYRVGITCQITFDSQSQTRTLAIDLHNQSTLTTVFTYVYNVPRDATSSSFSFQYPFSDNTNNSYTVRIASEDTETITFNKISFDIESLHLRQ